MKSFQLRISDDLHEFLESQKGTNASVVRRSLELYAVLSVSVEEGKKIFAEDPNTGERTELVILGLTKLPRSRPAK